MDFSQPLSAQAQQTRKFIPVSRKNIMSLLYLEFTISLRYLNINQHTLTMIANCL